MDLTVNQKKFADLYIQTGNASEAYHQVYKASVKVCEASGCRLIRNVKVNAYITECTKKLDRPTIATMIEIKEFWSSIAMTGTETVTINGQPLQRAVDINYRLKATEFLAKTNGAFIEKIDHSGNVGITIDVSKLSDKQINDMLRRVENE